ncbi:5-formyltetrahydrofolate cyclo-ligase [Ornithinibacillus sp. 4-3]|uniref:5-formyltetrahydrofolate cyclo-ligase n=1 Tax=Ornithinibacillus sp. 4-3 TaxID=3231488 RepID=A0AB39HMS9_9BACI
MDKKQLRKQMISTLLEQAQDEKLLIEQTLQNTLFNSLLWENAKSIGITISQGMEWDTRPIIEAAWRAGKSVCVPKCDPKSKELTFYTFESYDQLESVYFNLLEPKPVKENRLAKDQIDLLFVPGLIFDEDGYRIGFGGGFYDRFLVDFPNKTISLISHKQLIDAVPKEKYDISVQHIITERGFVK